MTDDIERLAGNRKRGKSRLKPAAAREAIGADAVATYPVGSDVGGGGIASPLTEVGPNSSSTTYQITSSDGLFIFEYESNVDFEDGNGDTVEIVSASPV